MIHLSGSVKLYCSSFQHPLSFLERPMFPKQAWRAGLELVLMDSAIVAMLQRCLSKETKDHSSLASILCSRFGESQ